MAISAYTGPPGAGKSYAMVEQVILPAYRAGRRVLTNIDGINSDAFKSYALERGDDPDQLGQIVVFHGDQAKEEAFWPTELTGDAATFIKGGDLVVFDEWKLYFPRRGKLPCTPKPTDDNPSPISPVEAFLRWHRHLTADVGGRLVACDVVIGTQLISDVNDNVRGLIENSYKFKKLKSVGLSKAFVWDSYDGHLQPKDGKVKTGNGTYKPEIFELYSSYSGGKGATELATDARRSIVGKWLYPVGGLGVLAAGWALFTIYGFFTGSGTVAEAQAAPIRTQNGSANLNGQPQGLAPAPVSEWRIAGFLQADGGVRVIVVSKSGALRVMDGQGFRFDGERPVAGIVDGQQVVAEDRVKLQADAPQGFGIPLPGAGI